MGCAFFILVLLTAGGVAGFVDERTECEITVRRWAEGALKELEDNQGSKELRDLLFFLHVPRTGGRTLYQCRPDCRFLSTHDDYSILSNVSKGLASVITNLRHPFERILSVYDFSIEVASRYLPTTKRHELFKQAFNASNGFDTLNIWPWKYLVPWMLEDLTLRYTGRNDKMVELDREVNLYDAPQIAMPLSEFIYHPMAFELVHNGATFQVAGLTNNSYIEDAKDIRNCVRQNENLGLYILDVAKKRIEKMFFVGLTNKHKDSAKLFATIIGEQIPSKWILLNHSMGEVRLNAHTMDKQDFVKELMKSYESCVKPMVDRQERRHNISLSSILPINTTLQGRSGVANSIMRNILYLNSLDLALYNHAQKIFNQENIVISNMASSHFKQAKRPPFKRKSLEEKGKMSSKLHTRKESSTSGFAFNKAKVIQNLSNEVRLYKILDIEIKVVSMFPLGVAFVVGCIAFMYRRLKSQKFHYVDKMF